MKVHPLRKERRITTKYDVVSGTDFSCRLNKLHRLPHTFAKVLELPFSSDADVIINGTPEFLRFVIETDNDDAFDDDVKAHAVEIYPGVTKIVIIGGDRVAAEEEALGELGIDVWRFRLPASTVPELASAAFGDGKLVVTIPKGSVDEDVGDDEDHMNLD